MGDDDGRAEAFAPATARAATRKSWYIILILVTANATVSKGEGK